MLDKFCSVMSNSAVNCEFNIKIKSIYLTMYI